VRAVILAGGEGTRLRPLTLGVPKPLVPVLDRPLLRYQLDLLATAGVSDVVFSIGYQPEQIQAVFGDGRDFGFRIRYAVEESPLGTGGAVKFAEPFLDETTIVFNGDVLTDVDLPGVVAAHHASGAAATLVLATVENPAAYGLVELDSACRVLRFVEKPDPDQITTNTINAGIYVLETRTLALIPPAIQHSIERGFFPALLQRGERVFAHVHRGYWIDIGTPVKYREVHRDLLQGRFPIPIAARSRNGGFVENDAVIDPAARLEGPFYIGHRCRIGAGARIAESTVLLDDVRVDEAAEVLGSIVWSGCQVGAAARLDGALLARRVSVGRSARLGSATILGEGARLPDHSRTG
jgi:mannose-1-phosphate guanylyltransferase